MSTVIVGKWPSFWTVNEAVSVSGDLGKKLIAKENYVMRRIPIAILGAFLLAMVAVPHKASAAILEFSSRPLWEAAVSGVFVEENFNDAVLMPPISGFTTVNGSIGGGTFNDAVDNAPVEISTTFNFSTPLKAFGGEWDLTPKGPGVGINLFADGVLVGGPPTVPNTFTGGFYGFVLTGGEFFNALKITGDGQPIGDRETYKLDNVVVSAVPIPAALPLFLSALAALGLLGWRRRRIADFA